MFCKKYILSECLQKEKFASPLCKSNILLFFRRSEISPLMILTAGGMI